jgi:hypothetical protein
MKPGEQHATIILWVLLALDEHGPQLARSLRHECGRVEPTMGRQGPFWDGLRLCRELRLVEEVAHVEGTVPGWQLSDEGRRFAVSRERLDGARGAQA